MTRPLRIEFPGAIHHVMSRGINRQRIYLGRPDYDAFLRELLDCVRRFEWRCLAYCLMDNHFHLLIETPQANLNFGMRDLKSGYAFGLNRRHGTSGPRFGERYKAKLVQDGSYLLAVARYIALNPVRANLAMRAEDYEWGSYRLLAAGEPSRLVDEASLLARLAPDIEDARRYFVQLVADGSGLPAYDAKRSIFGDVDFVSAHSPVEPPQQPVARAAWNEARPAISQVIAGRSREEAIRAARITYRYTLREIAEALGCSTETVRRVMRTWDVRT